MGGLGGLRISPSSRPPSFEISKTLLLSPSSLTNDGVLGFFAASILSWPFDCRLTDHRWPSVSLFSRRDLIPSLAPSWGMLPAVLTMRGIYFSKIKIAVNRITDLSPSLDLLMKYFRAVSIASVTISNSRRRLLTLSPNAFPAVRFAAKRDAGDDTPIEFIQVCDLSSLTASDF